MTTSHPSLSERVVEFFLQRESSAWGDEAERLRYYEAHSTILQLVTLIQPLVAAGFIFALGRLVLAACLTLWAVPVATMLVGTRYLERKGVRAYQLAERSLPRTFVLWVLPNLAPIAATGWVLRHGPGASTIAGVLVGAVIGIGAVLSRAASGAGDDVIMKTRTSGPVRGEDSSAGLVVRKRRTELRITQAALGEAVGVSRQTVISIETGDYAPSVFCALRVARVLGVTVEDLWGASA